MLQEGIPHLVDAGLQALRMTAEDLRHVEVSVLAGIFEGPEETLVLAIPIREQGFEPSLDSGRLGLQELCHRQLVTAIAVKDEGRVDWRRNERPPAQRTRQQGSYVRGAFSHVANTSTSALKAPAPPFTGALPPPGRKLEPEKRKMLRTALKILAEQECGRGDLFGLVLAERALQTPRSGRQKLGNEILSLAELYGSGQAVGAVSFLHYRGSISHLKIGLWNGAPAEIASYRRRLHLDLLGLDS